MSDIVKVENLTKIYNGLTVVDHISFSVKKGEIFGILGPNGAGKTTTLEMIETIRPIDEGQAIVAGVDVSKNPRKVKFLIGVQPQQPAFQDKNKLKEIIEMYAAAYGEKADYKELLDDVDLLDKADAFFEQLSGGQKQRLSIATSLVHNPKVFFMDEPTTGLDPQARRHLWELVKTIQKKGVTIIMTTHYMEEAEMLCDRVAIMDNGKIIALDSPKVLVQQLLKRGFKKKHVVEQADLEDVFIDLTGHKLRE
jgi:ABC-2 type transport system ATP-binding protein